MIKSSRAAIFIMGLAAAPLFNAGAQSAHESAQNEQLSREKNADRAKAALAEGNKAYKKKNYVLAAAKCQAACDLLPEAPITHTLRAQAIESFSQASVRLAEQRIAEGRYADAKAVVELVLGPKYNPTYKPATTLLAHLNDAEYYKDGRVPWSAGPPKTVEQLLTEAKAFYESARFDLAYKRYDQVLDLDPTNVAARKGQEKVNAARAKYITEAYDEMRKNLRYPTETSGMRAAPDETEYLRNKLRRIIIPRMEFREATVSDAIEFLKRKSAELDTTETDPTRKGVNIVLKLTPAPATTTPAPSQADATPAMPDDKTPASSANSPGGEKITLLLTNIPLGVALDYVTKLAGLKFRIHPYGVEVVPLSTPDSPDSPATNPELITKKYTLPPVFPGMNVSTEKSREYSEQSGVQFPPGAGVNFILTSGSPAALVVCDTEANLDLVDKIVKAYIIAKSAAPGESTAAPPAASSKEKEEK